MLAVDVASARGCKAVAVAATRIPACKTVSSPKRLSITDAPEARVMLLRRIYDFASMPR